MNTRSNKKNRRPNQLPQATPRRQSARLQQTPATNKKKSVHFELQVKKSVHFDSPQPTKQKSKSTRKSTHKPTPKQTPKSAARKERDESNLTPITTGKIVSKVEAGQKTTTIKGRKHTTILLKLSRAPQTDGSPILCSDRKGNVYLWDQGDGEESLVYKCNYLECVDDFKEEATAYAISQLHLKPDAESALEFLRNSVQDLFGRCKWDKSQEIAVEAVLDEIPRHAADKVSELFSNVTKPTMALELESSPASTTTNTTSMNPPDTNAPDTNAPDTNTVSSTTNAVGANTSDIITNAAAVVATIFKPVLENQAEMQKQQSQTLEMVAGQQKQQSKTLETMAETQKQQAETQKQQSKTLETVAAGQKQLAEVVATNKKDQDVLNGQFRADIETLKENQATLFDPLDLMGDEILQDIGIPDFQPIPTPVEPVVVETVPEPQKPRSRREFDAKGIAMWEVKGP